MTKSYTYTFRLLAICLLAALFGSCASEPDVTVNKPAPGEEVYVAPNITTRPGTINTNEEDRVKSVRVLVFDSGTGNIVANELLQTYIQRDGNGKLLTVWKDPIKITSGTRDFFFVANEVTDDWNVSGVLSSITHREQLFVEPALTRLNYIPDFKPTDGIDGGDRAFLMTAMYRSIDVTQSGAGAGTLADPYHFKADGDYTVDLVRTLSKLTVTIKNAVYREKATGNDEFYFSDVVFNKVMLRSIPKYFSLFNTQLFYQPFTGVNFFTANLYSPIADNYYTEAGATEDGVSIETDMYNLTRNEIPYPADPNELPSIGGIRVRDYQTTLYVPEYLRPYSASETVAGLGLSDAMSVEITLSPEWGAPPQPMRYSIDHVEFNRTDDGYHLINPASYSRYSVLRNTNYSLTAKEREYFIVDFNVTNWTQVNKYTMIGYGYNVDVSDLKFIGNTNEITVYSTDEACDPHVVTLEIPADVPATFADDTKLKTINLVGAISPVTYTINRNNAGISQTYLIVKYNGVEKRRFVVSLYD